MGRVVAPAGESLEATRGFLLGRLARRDPDSRAWAALSIGVLGAMLRGAGEGGRLDLTGELRSAFARSRSPSEVAACAVALGLLGDGSSSEALVGRLGQIKDDEARGYLCVGLALMGAGDAVPEIQRIFERSRYRPLLSLQAALALGKMGNGEQLEVLIQGLRDSASLSTQASIATALSFLGDARSVEPLLGMLEDGSLPGVARGLAAAALGNVAAPEDLTWNGGIGLGLNYRAATPTLHDQDGLGILDLL